MLSQIIFDNISADNLIRSSFNFVEIKEWKTTWFPSQLIMQSLEQSSFPVSGMYIKKALSRLINQLLITPIILYFYGPC